MGNRRRWAATLEQVLAIGTRALPMACTVSLCIGFVLALQGAAELRRFGGVNYVVDLVAVAFTRELGALVTAIAVSGRSASAISAEVGTMVVTEETDALRMMGLNPIDFTLAPRYLGALIAVPCLTILSTMCGIFAGYVFLSLSIDMSFRIYSRAAFEAPGDIVVSLDGKPIENGRQLQVSLYRRLVGEVVTLEILRDDQT
jgi:phospholipid/cholesterol/gamma-HCH transport system permease protein